MGKLAGTDVGVYMGRLGGQLLAKIKRERERERERHKEYELEDPMLSGIVMELLRSSC